MIPNPRVQQGKRRAERLQNGLSSTPAGESRTPPPLSRRSSGVPNGDSQPFFWENGQRAARKEVLRLVVPVLRQGDWNLGLSTAVLTMRLVYHRGMFRTPDCDLPRAEIQYSCGRYLTRVLGIRRPR